MKTKNLAMLAVILAAAPSGATLYTASVPDSNIFQNRNVNAPGSKYAAQYGHGVSSVIQKVVRNIIYDATPKQYYDLKILGMKTSKQVMSDEYFYHEIGFGRDPIILDTIAVPIPAATSQTLPILNPEAVSIDTLVVYPGNERGNVTSVNIGAKTITVTAETNGILPLVPAGAANTQFLANLSPVEADAMDSISQQYRIDTIERSNYIQMLVKSQKWGRMELQKYKNNGTLTNYLQMQRFKMHEQFRVDLSNVYWNGRQAEVTLSNGQKAKTTGGVFPTMQQVGSANAAVSMANLPAALEELALDTEFGTYGETRFLYGTPRAIHYLNQQYKRNLTRYTPNDDVAKLGLSSVDMGSSRIVFVPIKRFEEPSCFPASFRSKLFLLDQNNIQPVHFFTEEMGETLSRVNNGTLQNYTVSWISNTFGIEFYNPLACGWLDITDLP